LRGPEGYTGRVLVALIRGVVTADAVTGVQPETARIYLDQLVAVGLAEADGVEPHRRYYMNTPGKDAINWLAVVASRRVDPRR
jgi:hypothetical protein